MNFNTLFVILQLSNINFGFEIQFNFELFERVKPLLRLFGPEETVNFVAETTEGLSFHLSNLPNPRLLIDAKNPVAVTGQYYGAFFIVAPDILSLEATLNTLRKSFWYDRYGSRGKFLVLLPGDDFEDVFKRLWKLDILRVIVVSTTTLQTFTYETFNSCCGRIHVLRNPTRFPLVKFRNCNITVVNSYKPSPNGDDAPLTAVLIRSLSILETYFNATVDYKITTEIDKYLMEVDYVPVTNIFQMNTEFFTDYDLSVSFFQDGIRWAVPKPDKLTGYKRLLLIFKPEVWKAVLLGHFVVTVVYFFLHKFSDPIKSAQTNVVMDFGNAFLVATSHIMNVPTTAAPTSTSLKYLSMAYLFYSILIGTSFHANMVNVMTRHQYEKGIATIKELQQSGLPLRIHDSVVLDENWKNPKIMERVPNVSDFIRHTAYFRNCSFFLATKSVNVYPVERLMVDVIDEEWGRMDIMLVVRKGHYFLDFFNDFSRKLSQSGITDKILSDLTRYGASKTEKELRIVLLLGHLLGGFIWWAVGLAVALGVFLLEVLIYFCKFAIFKTVPMA